MKSKETDGSAGAALTPISGECGVNDGGPAADYVLTRTGAEAMKSLAAPVIGGMLSSLTQKLIVTPVVFL